MNYYEPIQERIEKLKKYSESYQTITLYEITTLFGHSSYFFLCLFLVIPFLQPVPLLGFSTVIGTVLAFFSAFIIAGQSLYMPDRMKRYSIASKTVQKWCDRFLFFCSKTTPWLHPRGFFLHKSSFMRKASGLVIFFSSLILALPLPFPATNTFPALTIAIISLGSLREDSVATAIGWGLFLLTLLYIISLVMIPISLVSTLER